MLRGSQAVIRGKRKIADTYPEFRGDYEPEKGPKVQRVEGKSQEPKRVTKKTKSREPPKSPIILRFQVFPGPNEGLYSDLAREFKEGVLADSANDIRAEFLFHVGDLPRVSTDYDYNASMNAISSTLYIDHTRLRLKMEEHDKKTETQAQSTSRGSYTLTSKQYDTLLLEQYPNLKYQQEEHPNTKGESGEAVKQNGNLSLVRVIVQENGIVYVQVKEQKYLVHRTSIVIPRLSLDEIAAATRKSSRMEVQDLMEDEDSMSGWESVA